uniref:Protein root UVB sensitive 6 n=1 Tax=Oryza nivara TaxID=4536 RepID=A0A0E0FWR2_ORYNI
MGARSEGKRLHYKTLHPLSLSPPSWHCVLRHIQLSLSLSNHCVVSHRSVSRPPGRRRWRFRVGHLTKPRPRRSPAPVRAAGMAPTVGIKRSAAAVATQTISVPPPDARFAVREAVRATIASPPVEAPPAAAGKAAAPAPAVEGFLCLEEVDGRRWSYVVDGGQGKGKGRGRGRSGAAVPMGASVRAVPLQSPLPPAEHFFGGAMGVFTTRTLLSSVGVSQSKVTPGAIAINWILKDGAGRVGKMLFARQGKKFDYDLKQLRFSSDLLLEIGAGIELATAAFPQFFLPMACVANVVKNVAAVTSTSTRTPIYKAYARGENIGDVTAKGESVGNIADLLGTGLSIFISKRNPSLVTSFAFLSCGYLWSSYHEVRSVVLNTLNRARFTVAVDSFIKTGHIPSLKEGNSQETIFNPPWRHEPIAIGSRFGEAFQEPASFVAIRPLFEDERYMVTYNPAKDKVYALLKDQAKSDDIIKAAFHAHVLLHFINASHARKQMNSRRSDPYGNPCNMDFMAHIAESCKIVSSSYGTFKKKAREQGWIMSESLLNPGKARLCPARP